MARILIIDDDEAMCFTLARMINMEGHAVKSAYTLMDGVREATSGSYDVVFLDVMMPEGSGLGILPKIKNTASNPEVIIMTADGNPEGAELAISNGAWDYIQKPFLLKEMKLPFLRALQYRQAKAGQVSVAALKLEGIVGSSPKIQVCLDAVARAAASEANVLVTGETGTGKELFARAIHCNSARDGKSFVVVDCAALPETLVESSLFGYEKGAFTGAVKSQEGMISQANRGTLFLDEIGELPIALQKAFLRVLQERRFRPVGGSKEVESDFRLIAATNRDLEDMVGRGLFREDLLYRLRSLTIELPPLRERRKDIPATALHYIMLLCQKYGIETKGISPDFLETLNAYPWPGNVRELINAIEGAIAGAGSAPTLIPQHLPAKIRVQVAKSELSKGRYMMSSGADPVEEEPHLPCLPKYREMRDAALEEAERRYLQEILARSRGSIRSACLLSGLGRTRLYALLNKHGLSRFKWSSF